MKKTKTLFQYFLYQDIFYLLLFCVIFFGILIGFQFILTQDIDVQDISSWILLAVVFYMQSSSSTKYNEYATYSYTRKRFYHYQVVFSVVRAILPALLQSLLIYFKHDEFVALFLEGTNDNTDMYHRLPWIEIFICNWIIFTVICFSLFLLSTLTYGIGSLSAQQKIRKNRLKKHHKRLYQICNILILLLYIVIVVVTYLINFLSYDYMLRAEFMLRVMVMAGFMAAFAVVYIFGRWWFTPKHI